ncbi:MAG: hypothetical protein ABSG07_12530 [Terriglobales bacterium]|jgi:hypothetical protein
MARSLSQTARLHHCVRLQAVRVAYATGSRLRIAKDVPVLRIDHVAIQVILPGVRKVAGSRDDKIKIDKFSETAFVGALVH